MGSSRLGDRPDTTVALARRARAAAAATAAPATG